MGYKSTVTEELQKLGITRGAKLCDCGSQDFAPAQVPALNRTLSKCYDLPPFPEDIPLPASKVFKALGMNYTCVDVDHREGTRYVDFHSCQFPRDMYDQFDVTLNAGTSEHLLNPLGLMVYMHQVTRVGGLMWHNVPVFGLANHGMNNLTPKFWHQIITYNRYEVVRAEIEPVDEQTFPPANFYGEHLQAFEGLESHPQSSALIKVILRKTQPYCFIPAFDVVDPTPGPRTEQLMRDALLPYVALGSLSQKEVDLAMDWHHGRETKEITSRFSFRKLFLG